MTLASDVFRHLQQLLAKVVGPVVLLLLLVLTSCSPASQPRAEVKESEKVAFFAPRPALKQVETPALIKELDPWLDPYSPQVQIRQPKADQVFDATTVRVSLRVQDLPIYKDETWGMGPHLEILLDNQPYDSIYDIDQPIILEDLSPGTHTLRVLAERPWQESFKNEGSYAQVTFHIFAKTGENAPAPNQPLLTYGSPEGTYGAEPVLLDFYLTDAPLHQVAEDNPAIADWRVRYTLNGDSLTLKDWRPIYIEGLKPGKNWIQLTLVDDEGNPLEGVFNNTARLINYDPDLNDTLAKIVVGDLTLEEVGRIIDPTYEPPVPEQPEVSPPSIGLEESEEPEESSQRQESVDTDVPAEDSAATPALDIPTESSMPEVIAPEASETVEQSDIADDPIDQSSPDKIDSVIETDALINQSSPDNVDSMIKTEDEETQSFDAVTGSTDLDRALDLTGQDSTPLPTKSIRSDESDIQTIAKESTSLIDPPATLESDTSSDTVNETTPVIEVEPSSENLTDTAPETTASSTRQYFKRLYDYSDRAMNHD